jgi:hypothetical protein
VPIAGHVSGKGAIVDFRQDLTRVFH